MEKRAARKRLDGPFLTVTCTFCGAGYSKRCRDLRPSGVNFCTRVCQSRYLRDAGQRWGLKESKLLQRLVADGLSVNEISWLMGWDQSTIVKYGGIRPDRARAWSDEENELLRDLAPHVVLADIGALLERSVSAITHRLTSLRLRRDPAFYAGRKLPYHACPPELQEVIRLQKQLKEKLRAEEHRRSA